MKFWFVFLAITLFSASCGSFHQTKEWNQVERLAKASNNAMIKKGFDLISHGAGGRNTISKVRAMFYTDKYKFKTVDEVRNFFIPIVEEYVRPFNEVRNLRPYFKNYPFGAKNLELTIIFNDEYGNNLTDPWISAVLTDNGQFVCSSYLGIPGKPFEKRTYVEDYYKAREQVIQSK